MLCNLITIIESLEILRNKILSLPHKISTMAHMMYAESTTSSLCISLLLLVLLIYITTDNRVVLDNDARFVLAILYAIYIAFFVISAYFPGLPPLKASAKESLPVIPTILWLFFTYFCSTQLLQEIPIKYQYFYLSFLILICSTTLLFLFTFVI